MPTLQRIEIRIQKRLDRRTGKHIIRVDGITSGFIVHGGDGNNMAIEFRYDASRFTPVIVEGPRKD